MKGWRFFLLYKALLSLPYMPFTISQQEMARHKRRLFAMAMPALIQRLAPSSSAGETSSLARVWRWRQRSEKLCLYLFGEMADLSSCELQYRINMARHYRGMAAYCASSVVSQR